MYSIVLFFLVAFSGCNGQFLNCGWVRSLDCKKYPVSKECGTNGVTFSNRCNFAKAQCDNNNLHIYADGECPAGYTPKTTPGPTSAHQTKTTVAITAPTAVTDRTTGIKITTPAGPTTTRAPIFLGHNAVLDFFCLELSHEICPTDTEQVCGTDNKTYSNFCEYEKARCTHRTLNVAHYGGC